MIQSLSWLELVLEKHSKNLVYIFKFESNDENIDIEQSILKAFINCKHIKQKLLLLWQVICDRHRFFISNYFYPLKFGLQKM